MRGKQAATFSTAAVSYLSRKNLGRTLGRGEPFIRHISYTVWSILINLREISFSLFSLFFLDFQTQVNNRKIIIERIYINVSQLQAEHFFVRCSIRKNETRNPCSISSSSFFNHLRNTELRTIITNYYMHTTYNIHVTNFQDIRKVNSNCRFS